MAVSQITGAPSAYEENWKTVNWCKVKSYVKRLQMRIAKAIQEKRYGKAKALQWVLTHSYYAKLLAVKRVTENSGGKTPGVDGVIWKTSKAFELAKLLVTQTTAATAPVVARNAVSSYKRKL